MMKEYHKFLADDPIYGPKAQRLAERTYEFSQFLYRVLGVKDVGATLHGKSHLSSFLSYDANFK